MNDVDELIKRELARESAELEDLLKPADGMVGMAVDAFKGSMGVWVWLIAAVNLIAAGFMFWCGYQFWVAADVDARMYWGIWFVVTTVIGTALKYWSWMEMNRTSLHKEISRLELAVIALRHTAERKVGEV